MGPANKIIWTKEMDSTLVAMIEADRFNKEIARELGISIRSVARRMLVLNIRRSADFNRNTTQRRGELIKEGQKNGKPRSEWGHHWHNGIPSSCFGHGRKVSPEAIAAGHIKAGQTRKELIARERIREKYGLPRLTNININIPNKRAANRRFSLRRKGYIVAKGENIAYYTEDTQRSTLMERRYRSFEFRPYETNRID